MRVVDRFPGRYAYHPVTGDAIRTAGEVPGQGATTLIDLADDLQADEQRAVDAIEGEIVDGVRANPRAARSAAQNLGLAGVYAVGCLNKFAAFVDAFDTTVNGLNLQYHYGGMSIAYEYRDSTPEERTEALDGLRADLDRQYTAAETRLDEDAEEVAGDFAAGPTPEAVKELVAAGFLALGTAMRFPSITYSDAELQNLLEHLRRTGKLDEFFAAPPLGTPSETLNRVLDIARRMGVDPKTYADVLQQYYVTKAAEKAGIDLTTWDVSQGAEAVSDHYERTYAYYAQLMLDNPHFRWAGMAAMIGPSFAAGFEDIEFFQTMARELAEKLGPIPDSALPFPVGLLDDVSRLGEDELRFYQTTFLQMQKDIFFDASMMHEAYLEGGMGSIDELRQAGLLGDDPQQADHAYNAWQDIDTGRRTGDTELLNRGNEQLLYREQFYTIADQYQDMKNHSPTGEVMTYMMGLVGQPSIPGTHTLGEVDDPIHVEIDTAPLIPGVQGGEVTINIPRSNIADFDTRWGLIEDDTMPAYLDLLKNDPDAVEDILNQDVRERIDEMRLSERWPDILDSLVDTEVRLW